MSSVIDNFPDISFIDYTQVDEVLNQMVSDYQTKYKELTGKDIKLSQADPFRLIMYACTMQIYQGMQYADYAGKMNFLKYSNGDYLDNLAALRGLERNMGTAATTVLEFSIDSELQSAVIIPMGTRATNGNEVYFATTQYAEIPAGSTSVRVPATCTEIGLGGNGFAPGEINTLVETLPYITEVQNVSTTTSGTDVETDDALRDRIFAAPGAYSTAGPAGAYEYYVKQADPTISDVAVYSNNPGEVDITFTVNGNQIPTQEIMDKVEAFIESHDVRPLTDYVVVSAPSTQAYNVNFTYYIARSEAAGASIIQQAVSNAVDEYNIWQTGKLGRDINPSYLIQRVMEAGAKRVEVTEPTRQVLTSTTLATLGTVNIVYGGLEDD